MRALTKKSVKDVTRRKLRTILTILGIAVGVMGLTAINVASAQLAASITYTNDASAQPDIAFVTSPADPALAGALAAQPNVKAAQPETRVVARWAGTHRPLQPCRRRPHRRRRPPHRHVPGHGRRAARSRPDPAGSGRPRHRVRQARRHHHCPGRPRHAAAHRLRLRPHGRPPRAHDQPARLGLHAPGPS